MPRSPRRTPLGSAYGLRYDFGDQPPNTHDGAANRAEGMGTLVDAWGRLPDHVTPTSYPGMYTRAETYPHSQYAGGYGYDYMSGDPGSIRAAMHPIARRRTPLPRPPVRDLWNHDVRTDARPSQYGAWYSRQADESASAQSLAEAPPPVGYAPPPFSPPPMQPPPFFRAPDDSIFFLINEGPTVGISVPKWVLYLAVGLWGILAIAVLASLFR